MNIQKIQYQLTKALMKNPPMNKILGPELNVYLIDMIEDDEIEFDERRDKRMSKKFIQISNNTPTYIGVIPSILSIDATNKYSPVKDRLNIKPAWMNMKIEIVPGVGWYPIEIKDWESVKSLAKINKFTIGQEADIADMPEEWKQKVEEMSKKLANAKAKYESDVARNTEILKADAQRPGAE